MTNIKLDLDKYIRLVLLIGISASVFLLTLGLVWHAVAQGEGEKEVFSFKEVFSEVTNLNPIGIIDLGILLLIATPLTRIVTAIITFVSTKEKVLACVSTTVLIIVLISFAIGTFR